MFNQGEQAIISRDIMISGNQAFSSGQRVTIEMVAPDPGRPENRYVVFSSTLGSPFLLADADLVPAPDNRNTATDDVSLLGLISSEDEGNRDPVSERTANKSVKHRGLIPPPQEVLPPDVLHALAEPSTFELKSRRSWVIGGCIVTGLLVFTLIGFLLMPWADRMIYGPAEDKQATHCRANQQVIRSAITSYQSRYGNWPSSVSDLTGSGLLNRRYFSCPAGGAYIWVAGSPPTIRCIHSEHNLNTH